MCPILRRSISAREEEEGEKREPAQTRQARRLHGDVQTQTEVTSLEEEPAEEQVECPRGCFLNLFSSFNFLGEGCGKKYPSRLPGEMRRHLQRAHKEDDLLHCDNLGCKYVS